MKTKVVLSGRLTVWVLANMTCILLLTTGSCGNEEWDRTGSTLSDILWRNQNAMIRQLEDCSLSERYFYSTVMSNEVCNNLKKWIYKQQRSTPTVSCTSGYILHEGSCVKECIAVPSAENKFPVNMNYNSSEEEVTVNNTINNSNGTTEGTTDVGKTDENGLITTTEKMINEAPECTAGCYGDLCQSNCLCENNSTCDMLTGQCTCTDGWTGVKCEKECPRGTYGANCSQTCICDVTSCHPVDGCICRSQGQNCNTVCPLLTFGHECSGQCRCMRIGTRNCGVLDGSCTCKPGWTGTRCEQLCPAGRFGEGCQQTCDCYTDEYCNPTTGVCLCWDIITGLNCTLRGLGKRDVSPICSPQQLVSEPIQLDGQSWSLDVEETTTTAVPVSPHPKAFSLGVLQLHIAILVGGGLLIIIALACTIVAWRRNRSHGMSQYKFNNKDSTLKIVHADLPPREDLSRYQEETESNKRTHSCKNKRKSHQDGAKKQPGILNLPSRVKCNPPSTVLGFQQYSPTDEGSLDFGELTRHSYVNLKDAGISQHVIEDTNDYERLNKDDIASPFQDYEVCVKADGPYENVPAKKRSILGSLKKLVRRESRPDSDRTRLSDDAGISRTSFVTFNK